MKFFRRIILPSEKFVTLKFLHAQLLRVAAKQYYTSWYFLNLHTVSYFHVASRLLPDPAGPLSSELLPPAIAEVNAAVNGVQQAKTKETKKREIDLAEDRAHVLYARANTVLMHSIFGPGYGVLVQELHPLLPGEQFALWVKLNSVKFLCHYRV